jgi:membrane-associated phospholipid phosphatase
VLLQWILPPAVLLLGYWVSGLLFAAPMPRVERLLETVDRALGIDRLAAGAPTWIANLLEIAYVAVYPVVPFALAIHLLTSAEPDADRFWTVILVTDFICFGVLPWVQTRPPRALRRADPWRSCVRAANLALLGRTSIQVNTFPSGHVAEALAAALLVADAPWPLAAAVATMAVCISVGAVLGRYHYAMDAVAGIVVALVVWVAVGR